MAKVSPGQFINQVRAETAKVHWPTRKETVWTAMLVAGMTTILALFFLSTDFFFSSIVSFLLGRVGQ